MFIDKNNVARKPKAYLAGTEIFYANSEETQKKYHELCDKYGIIAHYPADIAPDDEFKEYTPKDDSVQEMEMTFFTHDVNHLKRTDIIIANLNDYRGNEPDSGTAVECGIAYGLGHRCFAFIDDASSMINRFKGVKKINKDGKVCDKDFAHLEDFDMPVNLMFSEFTIFEGGLEEALIGIRKIFDEELERNGYPKYK